jgi:DNA-binding transcriptional MocR family regulator
MVSGRTAREIAMSIEERIREHQLRPGQRLQTIRQLAIDLGVSPMTVATAYAELRRRGLVSAARRRGTRVSEQPPIPVSRPPLVPPGTWDLATGNPDPALLPPLASALARIEAVPRAHPHTNKLEELAGLARAGFAADGIPYAAIAVVAGALDGLERVLAAHLVPGDVVAVEDPTFARILDLLGALGLVAYAVAVDDDGLLPDALDRALRDGAKALLLTPRWQNPYGARLTSRRALELRAVLGRHEHVLVIEDDHAGLIARERAYSLACTQRWATIRSASKAFGADYRLAVMAGDAMTIARVEGRQLLGTGWVSLLLQQLVFNLWSDPSVQRLLTRATSVYARRRTRLIEALAARGIRGIGVSGLNVWIPVADETAAVAGMLQRGWAVAAGERFRVSTGHAIRITISTLADDKIDSVADDLVATLERTPAAFAS